MSKLFCFSLTHRERAFKQKNSFEDSTSRSVEQYKMTALVHIIDVESGNLQSLTNAIKRIGDFRVVFIHDRIDFEKTNSEITKLIFPGVGNFGHFVKELKNRGLVSSILEYIESGREIMGICVGLQSFFESSEESTSVTGLGLLNVKLRKFDTTDSALAELGQRKSVPHIGWNSILDILDGEDLLPAQQTLYGMSASEKYYFVHSYAAIIETEEERNALNAASKSGWSFAFGRYGGERFLASISYKGLFATQFHPEKSGAAGLKIIEAFLNGDRLGASPPASYRSLADVEITPTGLSRRIIACLDVRANDAGDLVVTKGDQYDVREKDIAGSSQVRNLGKPVELATKYYKQGADEITFLNITSFRNSPIEDLPMLEVLRKSAENIFVPLTVGGGIRDMIDPVSGEHFSALRVAELYFRSGADKVSIGSEAVSIAEKYYANGKRKEGNSAIETISACFGNQAVVISVDPKRKYVSSPLDTSMATIHISEPSLWGPNGEKYCYFQVTSRGGRQTHDLGALELCQACEDLGAGEILLNSIDNDGSNNGFNLQLLQQVKSNVSIPVIASSGAGKPEHFRAVFSMECGIDAALGAGIFHRDEYDVNTIKLFLRETGKMDVRLDMHID